jgi:ribonuclease BN (tRNA processing enzyme)
MISLTILGTGGAVPTRDRSPSAAWLTIDGRSLLVDPGPGALVGLVQSPHGPDSLDEVDAILLTHLHLDHCADLAPLLFALHSVVLTSRRPLQIIGPRGLAGYLGRLRDLYGDWLTPRLRPLEVLEVSGGDVLGCRDDGRWTAGPPREQMRLEAFRVEHGEVRFSAENLGWHARDRDGRSLVLSGDTGPCRALEDAARGTDLLVVECSTPDELAIDGHMSPSRVGALVAAAGPRRVVLTHVYPAAAALDLAARVREHAATDVVVASDGDRFVVTGDPPPLPEPRKVLP